MYLNEGSYNPCMKKRKLVFLAEKFAKKAHEGQRQVTGKPYFEHPKEVARLLKNLGQDEEVISAGYLHDVVEDCGISLKEVKIKFGAKVAFLVEGMSWIKSNGKKDFDASCKKFTNFSKKEPALILIKLADMTANLPNLSEPSHREWIVNKSYPRNMTFYIPFMRAVGMNKQSKKIVDEFHKYTKKPIKSVLYDYISKAELKKIKSKLPLIS